MDISRIRDDFPTLKSRDHIYLDSACQSLKPKQVIDSILSYYNEFPACGGRSVHSMATKVSMKIDDSREKVARFLGAVDQSEIVFTKNCTESLNIVAKGIGLKKNDVVVTSDSEHNSNHIPWMDLVETAGIKRKFFKTSEQGEFNIEEFKKVMDKNVKIVSITHMSNVTGVTFPTKDIIDIAHEHGALVMADGAQAAPHVPVNMKKTDVDFYTASGHKMLGPSGTGILYGKAELLKTLRPLISGGGTVGLATYDSIKLSPPPERFEAGLLNYSGIIGMGAAVDYLMRLGMDKVQKHEKHLQNVLSKEIEDIGIKTIGPEDPKKRGGIFSFNIDGLESHDVAMMLDAKGIMIRSGMHCAHPFFVSRGVHGCARASMYLYNDDSDVIRFADSLKKIIATFA